MALVGAAAQDLEGAVVPGDLAAEAAVVTLLRALGEDVTREGLERTPARVVKALREMTGGYQEDPAAILATTFDPGGVYDELVVLRGVRFTSLCEHHVLPFSGVAHVGYLPKQRVVGLSKLARLVACYARRLQVQERMTLQIADAVMKHLEAQGVAVVVEATHSCMGHRGARQPEAVMVTSCMYGTMRESDSARAEFMRLIRQ